MKIKLIFRMKKLTSRIKSRLALFMYILIILFYFPILSFGKNQNYIETEAIRQNDINSCRDYKKYDYDTIYRHISEMLRVGKRSSRFTKLLKGYTYGYKLSGLCEFTDYYNKKSKANKIKRPPLNCERLVNLFDENVKKISEYTGVQWKSDSRNPRIEFVFAKNEDDLKKFAQNELIRSEVHLKETPDDYFKRIKEDFFDQKTVVHIVAISADVRFKKEILYIYTIVRILVFPDKSSRFFDYKIMNSIFNNLVFQATLEYKDSKVILNTLSSVGKNAFIRATLTCFDTQILEAVYSDSVEYGMDRKKAAETISHIIYSKLKE